jgi:hypothetical protein
MATRGADARAGLALDRPAGVVSPGSRRHACEGIRSGPLANR